MNPKFLLSSLVVLLFASYVVLQHDRLVIPFSGFGKNSPSPSAALDFPSELPDDGQPVASLPPVFSPPVSPSDPPTQIPPSTPAAPPAATTTSRKYKDGTYAGSVADAYYGSVQVQAVIQGGAITAVNFLQYPNTHGTSVFINSQAMPMLKTEAIQAQSAQVDVISGATFTSQAYQASLSDALNQAMN